jgi:hypothetical protein
MGVDQLDEAQFLGQGIEESRGAKLPDLHGLERRKRFGVEANWARIWSMTRPGQVDLLDDASVAIDGAGADQ